MKELAIGYSVRTWKWFKERAHGPHALFWLAALSFFEPTISPIISEAYLALLIFAGVKRWKTYAALATIAATFGGALGYFIGATLFATVGEQLIVWYNLGPHVEEARMLLSQHVFWSMVVTTPIPVVDRIMVLLAGFLHVNFFYYIAGYAVGRAARYFLAAWLFVCFGKQALEVLEKYRVYAAGFVILLVLVAAAHLFGWW